jgi:hypothetical protein
MAAPKPAFSNNTCAKLTNMEHSQRLDRKNGCSDTMIAFPPRVLRSLFERKPQPQAVSMQWPNAMP